MRRGARRVALGIGLSFTYAVPGHALGLGALEVLSTPGQRIEARIPVRAASGEALRGACFALLPDPTTRASALVGGTLELRRHARGADLLVRAARGRGGNAAAFAIAIRCPASVPPVVARFSLAQAPPSIALPVVTRLAAREGDSLAALAHAIFPGDDSVRARYLQALRAENPWLASLADEAPIGRGTSIALPDLHAFARTIPAHRAPTAPVRRVAAAPVTVSDGVAPRASRTASAVLPAPESASDGFRLRLSAPVLDLSPSKDMNERRRAALRERLLVLEADDRTSAMLAMHEKIRGLETLVATLKLELTAMPAVPTSRAPPPAKADARPSETPPDAGTPEAQRASKPEPATASHAEPPASPVAAGAAKAEPAARRPPRVIPQAEGDEPWYASPWVAVALAAILALGLVLRMRRRRERTEESDEAPYADGPETEIPEILAAADSDAPQPIDEAETPAAGIAPLETRAPAEDNAELRRRYMEERFPEIANGALVLEDPRSVVQAACLLYDDGAAPRAIELLHFAIEQDAHAIAPWLALFDIFRRERLPGEYAELAARLQARHGATDEWRKVRSVGRSIDPDRPLYEGVELGLADPDAEGWLRVPGGDAPHPLAARLRERLMAQARVAEEDLRADPTPALRKAETFSVA